MRTECSQLFGRTNANFLWNQTGNFVFRVQIHRMFKLNCCVLCKCLAEKSNFYDFVTVALVICANVNTRQL